jgi:hypothetical protein
MTENWKQIEGFDNYEVSEHGRVRNSTTNKLIKPYQDNGRMAVTLYANNTKFGRRLHNLVAHGFVPNPDPKEFVYNVNFDNVNCRADNLFWISGLECNKHATQQVQRTLMLQELRSLFQEVGTIRRRSNYLHPRRRRTVESN